MQFCFTTIIVVAIGVFAMLSLVRWFEQIIDSVDTGWWSKTIVLIAIPFLAWFYPAPIAAGRPSPVPHHEPVRGFGSVPSAPGKKKGIEPDKIAKLRERMKKQKMMED
ncbi:MAG: hypothetical protein ACREJC_13180 [Tepidisphaeraceae bacterium]